MKTALRPATMAVIELRPTGTLGGCFSKVMVRTAEFYEGAMKHNNHDGSGSDRTLHNPIQDRLVALEPLDLSRVHSVDDLVRAMAKTAFTGRQLGEAADVLEAMARDKDCFVVMTLSGAMTVASWIPGLGPILNSPSANILRDFWCTDFIQCVWVAPASIRAFLAASVERLSLDAVPPHEDFRALDAQLPDCPWLDAADVLIPVNTLR